MRGAVRRGTLSVLTGFCYLVAALRRITGGDSLNTKEHRVGMAMETINKGKKNTNTELQAKFNQLIVSSTQM